MKPRPTSRDGWILPFTATVIWLLDQGSKYLVVSHLLPGQPRELCAWTSPIFQLTYTTNTGTAFGLFPGLKDVIVVVAALVIAAIVVYQHQLPDEQWQGRVALGFQLGGALGNLTDRLVRGSVVDFVDLNFWPLGQWPIFNLADAAIVTGTSLLALLIIQEARQMHRDQEQQPDAG